MNYLSPEDQQLIEFLKDYRPLPPSNKVGLEDQIIHQLKTRNPTKESLGAYRRIIGFSGIVVAGILAIWGGFVLLKPSSQLAESQETEVLESFLVDSWQSTTGESVMSTETTDWLLLDHSESEITVSDD